MASNFCENNAMKWIVKRSLPFVIGGKVGEVVNTTFAFTPVYLPCVSENKSLTA
jgi:hypothetical protein